jgi:oligopeptide transport system permease protein
MTRYLIKKILILLGSLFIVTTATFFLMHALPGNPFIGDEAIAEEVMAALNRHWGLDKPLIWQYALYLKGLLFFDAGPSIHYQGRSVNQIIGEGFPVSFLLGLEALVLSITGGLLMGALGAHFRLGWHRRLSLFFQVLGISIPGFLFATFLQYLFSIYLNLLPVARWGTFSHTILPAVTLSLFPFAFIARLSCASFMEVMQQDYVVMARAKGLKDFYILWRHVARNALIPVVVYLGPLSASVFTGSFVIEKVFGIPGLGGWLIVSISNRDYPIIMGLTIFYSALLLVSVFLSDLLCCFMDPRIKINESFFSYKTP